MRILKISLLLITFILILTACSGKEPAVQTVEAYLNAIVDQNDTALTTLVCDDFQFDAMLEMDSFLAVSPKLENLSCSVTGDVDGVTLVNCTGSILATYNDEQQNLDLSGRTFQVIENAGELQVCGYQQP